MITCKTCGQPQRKLWAWGERYPKWVTIRAANFLGLVKCPECGSLWLEAAYEPFASFRYAVHWTYDEGLFTRAMDKDSGVTLNRWHEAEVRLLANTADQETLAQIEAHYRRSRGYVNLTMSDRPNTIQLGE
jgi:hypothetical protein